MITEEMLQQMEATGDPQALEMAARLREQMALRARLEAEYRAAGDWDRLLGMAESQTRAAILVEALDATPDIVTDGTFQRDGREVKRDLIREWFSICDALLPQRDQLRAHLDQLDFFTDEEGAALMPNGFEPGIVYRGAYHDDEVDRALSWTQDRPIAERFARGLTGMRSRIVLGMYREDATPTIFRGYAEEGYAFFNGRGEFEVVAKKVVGIAPIAELVAA